MHKIISLFVLMMAFTALNGQPVFPDNGPLYNDETVPRIDITIDPGTLEWLYQYENLESNIEFSARFVFDNGEIRDTIEPVGFRLRGNTSRYSNKKSFKVSFNTFTSGGKYFGVEKLNLNGEHNDPSVMRAKVCWDILRKWEIPASRSNHVQLYINDEYYGLYLNVEHIDEEFVKSRFEKNDGNLFKCLYPADLDYLGSNPDLYKMFAGDRRVYELKTNTEADDYSDLAEFINVLNNTPEDELVCRLDEVFNIYDYLKVIAVDILTANWDGPIYNKNNFYLYHNTTSDKFEYIPYDLDNTLGIDWFGVDWANRNIYNWSPGSNEPRPIYNRLMDNVELRDQYSNYIKTLVLSTIDFDSLNNALLQTRNRILPYITNDYYYTLDYGFSTSDFMNSLWHAFGAHVKHGISQFLQERTASIISQVENEEMSPVIKYIKHQKVSSTEAQVVAYVAVQFKPANVSLEFSLDGSNWNSISMFDDGNHNDGLAGDLIYGATISDLIADNETLYQIFADDSHGNVNLMPCEPVIIPAEGETPLLFINEFMASNDNTIADEHGNYSDWIEIFNGSDNAIWLGDKFLTDNLGSSNKWQLPDFTLGSGGFILFWADGNPGNGEFHTNFKLSKDGEEIGIFSESFSVIDEIIFGPQTGDISFGRGKDGSIDWVFFETPTPGASNSPDAINEIAGNDGFILYPNPANAEVVYVSSNINYKVYNIFGRIVGEAKNYDKINISGYNKGIYIVVSDEGRKQKLIIN
ncbi:MAG: CotH kinase family protein [Bacteroidales bacterium]|nr:CotH kinase family protein [Bacteroidales bacterium]